MDEETQVQRNVEDEMFDLRENFEQVRRNVELHAWLSN